MFHSFDAVRFLFPDFVDNKLMAGYEIALAAIERMEDFANLPKDQALLDNAVNLLAAQYPEEFPDYVITNE
jgi:hypothetical protein